MKNASNTAAFIPTLSLALFPAAATLMSFYLEVLPHLLYPLSKALMVLLPILAWRRGGLGMRDMLDRASIKRTSTIAGLVSGTLLGGIVVTAYFVIFADSIDPMPILTKLTSLGLVEHYLISALFIALWNSALEEWFWRGFLLDRMQNGMSATKAVLLNGLLFGVHHYFTLQPYFPNDLALFFTFGTVVAGVVWAVMRVRNVSLIDCWISHVLADLAVVSIGWILLQRALAQ